MAIFWLLFFTQCIKPDDQPEKEVTKTTEMNISPSFNWSSTKSIDVAIQGVPVTPDNRKTLLIYSDEQIFLKELYNINQNLDRTIHVPAFINTLSVKYGDFQQSFDITNGKIELSFIPNLPEE
jgi:hypothetical protein